MMKLNEGDLSPIVRSLEPSASVTPDKMVPVDLSGAEISREQAPRKRGLLGPFGVWAPVLAKAAGTVGMLSCVALLGFHSRAEDTYGTTAPVSPGAGLTPVATDPGTPPPNGVAVAEKPAQPEVKKEAEAKCPVPPPCQGEKPQAAGIAADGKIILNEASVDELTRLPGVGKARAEAIVALRVRLKGFRKVSDLLRIRGIGFRTLEKMKEQILLDRPVTQEQPGPEKGDPVPEKG